MLRIYLFAHNFSFDILLMKSNSFKKNSGKGLKIAIVQARFNEKITGGLLQGAVKALWESGVAEKDVAIYKVPGSFEIPLACQKIAKSKKFDGIVAIGAVIKGETAHFEYIAQPTVDGIMRVMLDERTPISMGVITTYNLKQAQARAKDNKSNKGYEAAMALLETLS